MPFDRIYILTSRHTSDRLPVIMGQIDRMQFPEDVDIRIFHSPSSRLIMDTFLKSPGMSSWARRHPNTIWCTFGHYLIYHDIVDTGCSRALVLEDDIMLMKDREKLFSFFSDLPKDTDIANIDWWPKYGSSYYKDGRFSKLVKDSVDNKWIEYPTDREFGVRSGGAYIVSRYAAEMLISEHDMFSDHMTGFSGNRRYRTTDEFFESDVMYSHGIKCMFSNPPLAIQRYTDGNNGGGKPCLYELIYGKEGIPKIDIGDYGN